MPEAHRRRRQAARKVTAVACHPSQCRRTSPSGPQAAVGRRTPPPSVSLSSKRRDRVRGPSAKGSLFPSTGRGEAAAATTEGDVEVGWGSLYGCRCVPSSSGREVERRNCTCRKWVLDRPRCAFADYSSPSVLNITSPRKKGKERNRPLQLFHHGWFSQLCLCTAAAEQLNRHLAAAMPPPQLADEHDLPAGWSLRLVPPELSTPRPARVTGRCSPAPVRRNGGWGWRLHGGGVRQWRPRQRPEGVVGSDASVSATAWVAATGQPPMRGGSILHGGTTPRRCGWRRGSGSRGRGRPCSRRAIGSRGGVTPLRVGLSGGARGRRRLNPRHDG